MSNETIKELRSVLFETLRGLSNKESPMDIDRARAINDTAQTIINSAKVEVDHIRAVGSGDTGFIPRAAAPTLPAPESPKALPGAAAADTLADGTEVIENKPGVRVVRHTLKG